MGGFEVNKILIRSPAAWFQTPTNKEVCTGNYNSNDNSNKVAVGAMV